MAANFLSRSTALTGVPGQLNKTQFVSCRRRYRSPDQQRQDRGGRRLSWRLGRGTQDRRARGRLLSGASIWIASLLHDGCLLRHADILSCSEAQETARHRNEAQRRRTLAGKILLRLALSQAVDNRTAPSEWRLSRETSGKPVLAQRRQPLNFSIAHNDLVTVVAVANGPAVGVDVESPDQNISPEIVRYFLSAREQAALRRSDPVGQGEAVVRLWTLKEAYAKMTGAGLGTEFAALEVGLDQVPHCPGADPALLQDWTVTIADELRCQLALALGDVGQERDSSGPDITIFTIGSLGDTLLL